MLISCPTCASSYRINAAKIGPEGRSVRCAACRETWFLSPTDALVEDEAPVEILAGEASSDPVLEAAWSEAAASVREAAVADEVPPALDPEIGRERKPAKSALKKKATQKGKGSPLAGKLPPLSPAALLGLGLLAALPVTCLARNQVVGVMPRTAPLFSAVGLAVNRRGLEIRDVVASQSAPDDEQGRELVVEGDVVGVGRGVVPMPPLTVTVSDAAGKVVATFPAQAPRSMLGTGETARFRVKLADPPAEGRAVNLRFADAAPAEALRAGQD